MSESGFLRRWAQRKAQVTASPQQKPSTPDLPSPPAPLSSHAPQARSTPDAGSPAPQASSLDSEHGQTEAATEGGAAAGPSVAAPGDTAPLPVLDDLTPADDFSPFMRAGIDSGTRNAALRKLFADPHFNVMDGLDIYIDDYSKPDPMPASMLRALRHARTLGLVDDEDPVPSALPDAEQAHAAAERSGSPEAGLESHDAHGLDPGRQAEADANADADADATDTGCSTQRVVTRNSAV